MVPIHEISADLRDGKNRDGMSGAVRFVRHIKETMSCHCPPQAPGRAARRIVQWLAPGVVLALIPKCPACLAAWIAAATGIGLSLHAASLLRGLLVAICVVAFAWLIARQLRRFRRA